MDRDLAEIMKRLRAEIEGRGLSVNQVAKDLGIRPASFTDGSLSRWWIQLAKHIGFSLDWVLLGQRNLAAENKRLTDVVADLSSRLQALEPSGATQSERELADRHNRGADDVHRADRLESPQSRQKRKTS